VDGLKDEKLTGFALRLALTVHRSIPVEGDIDFLAEAETAFCLPKIEEMSPVKKRTACGSNKAQAATKSSPKKNTAA
jgi:ParB family chromosome partitioning protein